MARCNKRCVIHVATKCECDRCRGDVCDEHVVTCVTNMCCGSPVEVTSDKIVYLLFCLSMEILELVKSTEGEGEGEGEGEEKVGGLASVGERDGEAITAGIQCQIQYLNLMTLRPLGRMMSGFLFSRCSASSAVTSETVLRMCAQ